MLVLSISQWSQIWLIHEPLLTTQCNFSTAKNLNNEGVTYAQLNRTRQPTAIIQAYAGASAACRVR